MAREVTVITPENVAISYELAGLGSRALAYLLDVLLQIVMLVSLFLMLAGVTWWAGWGHNARIMQTLSDFATAIIVVSLFVVTVGYFIYFETVRSGQTPGKRALGLRVIREEGGPIDFSGAAIRNLVRVLELILLLHFSSLLFILISPKYKRLGDYAAGTIVVKERRPSTVAPEAPELQPAQAHAEAMFVRDVHLLSMDELATLRRYIDRRGELKPDVQETLARQIAAPIMSKLGVDAPKEAFSYANFLEEVHRRSVEERGLL